ncbi:DNA-binding response regulator [Lentibacillus kapialis]|uniref:DNA-binding response regulator n=1 Tax=Lentibacillus kapialis TaxID=340214 RepID=A0A917PWK0_9BACI|nr:response regulator transcription factor [Lentibacillus kapialis]GGJ95016.1 DNA-binding response regulator [Lentibacillus kapialis]
MIYNPVGDNALIHVMLVDAQRLFREGVEALINNRSDIAVIAMADDGEQAIALLEEAVPDVILMDIHMHRMDGIRAAAYIKDKYPAIKIVMLTDAQDEERIIRAIKVGADGFLLKDLNPEKLIQSIKDAYNGQNVLSGDVASLLVNRIRDLTLDKKQLLGKRLDNQGIRFTKRELDIAYLMFIGHSNQAIAEHLFLGQGTVKNYISDIYRKLDIRNRRQVVSYLLKLLT